ncbi:acyltransferase [Arthrobacter sp. Bz4]|uniref:acyltransferase family protein n=1 Tax=Arthrobacter sp. Bz4 TaxID=2171979 RepID=UPI000D515EC6|nr:acyltransferase [Arthrobacter sp. Bz4]PVE14969.1 hypothetical protein DDA93_15315 [Arthrobacter sp. Bz4]
MSAPAVPLNAANRYAHIDAMRAFAVMLVVIAHAGYGGVIPGGSGVTIFFSISGFIITYLLLKERDKTGGFSASGFYFRRALKIMPPLLIAIILPTLIHARWANIQWTDFLAQVFFLFNWLKARGDSIEVLPGTEVVWSLSIEEQFYIVFALVWLLAVRTRHWRAVITGLAVLGVVYSTVSRMIFASLPDMGDRIYYGSDTRLDGIAMGVLTAIGYHYWQSREGSLLTASPLLGRDSILVAAVLLYLVSLLIRDEWFRDTLRFSVQSIAACAVIVYGLLPGNGRLRGPFIAVSQWRVVSLLGLASYSIYLVHFVVAKFIREFFTLPADIEGALSIGLGTGLGIMLYELVEVPVRQYGQAIRKRQEVLA